MEFENFWNKALKHTEIIRPRVQPLMALSQTHVPYIFLAESVVNVGDTVVRKGEVLVEKPSLFIPPNNPQFSGFDFDTQRLNETSMINFLIVRGISIPSFRYDNKTSSLDVYEGKLTAAVKYYQDLLQQNENVYAGLITGPEDCWQFSLLIFICGQIIKNADLDIKKLLDEFKKRQIDE